MGASFITVASMRMPASSARSCSSFSLFSSGLGGSVTNFSSAARSRITCGKQSGNAADQRSHAAALALAVGIGRFAYTPLLPAMQEAAGFGTSVAGWIADRVGGLVVPSLAAALALVTGAVIIGGLARH